MRQLSRSNYLRFDYAGRKENPAEQVHSYAMNAASYEMRSASPLPQEG
jgi:hypothetical protein